MSVVQGTFLNGEIRNPTASPVPSKTSVFSRIENAYIEDDTTLKVRNPFREVSKVIPKAQNFFTAKIYSYPSIPSPYHNRILIIQFGALTPGSSIARITTYSLVDTDTGVLLKDNERFLPGTNNNIFFPEHFDLEILRSAGITGEEETERVFFAIGGRYLFRFKIDNIGDITDEYIPGLAVDRAITYPYAVTKFGAFLVMACFNANSPVIAGFEDSKAFGTRIAFFSLNAQDSETISLTLFLQSGERLFRSAAFAESIFFITNQGLLGITFQDQTNITGTNVIERKISSFEGRDVAPRILHANFLYYAGDEIRVRDISSLQANIVQAGDFIALPSSEPTRPVLSGQLFGEDVILFIQEDRKTFKALVNMFGQQGVTNALTTFYVSDQEVLDFYSGEAINWFYMTEEDEQNLCVKEYNSRNQPTESSIKVTLETSQFPLVMSQDKMRIHIDKQGHEFTEVPGNRFNFDRENKSILSVTNTTGDRRFSNSLSLSFSTTGSMRVLLYQLWYQEFLET